MVCCSIPSINLLQKSWLIAFACLKLMYVKIWKNLQILSFLGCFFPPIFGLKIWVFDEVYAYLILQFAIVFPASVKKFILIEFVYQKLLHCEISTKLSKIKEFSLFPNFVVKLKAFGLTYDILYFLVIFPV